MEIRSSLNFNLIIAHVNHGVRGEDARADQLFVEEISKNLNIPYYTKNVNMIEYGKERGISSEEAGRELRYGFFREILEDLGGGKIAVAHNMNDQGETLLMRIMRGSGIDGLKGMGFVNQDIIRPILGIDRKEIEAYIAKEQEELQGEFCRGCGYCMPCPVGIEINNRARMSLLPRRSPSSSQLTEAGQAKMKKIEECLHCGKCKSKCPYGLDTPTLLEKNYEDYKQVLAGEVSVN